MLKCPQCDNQTHVLESRAVDTVESPNSIRRRRECLSCKFRFTTYEGAVTKSSNLKEPQSKKVFARY
jgi:transcriptional repressor NrdR